MKPSLVVTVDTEEEGLWSGNYKSRGNTVRNVQGVPRFQAFCDRMGIRPTYLVDSPVVESKEAVEILRDIHDAGRAEIGAHLHPWCTPPIVNGTQQRYSYMCNLPAEQQRAKLAQLTLDIERKFDRRPTSFRAGRYGLDIVGARILEELGYLVDSSVIAFSNLSQDGGPDFSQVPLAPYYIGGHDLCAPQATGRLLEVPVSVGYNRRSFDLVHAIRERCRHPLIRPWRVIGILDRLGIIRQIKFSPEQADASRMNRLVDMYLQREVPCMVMMLHSSSLMPGYSPYVPDQERLERLYADLQTTFEYCFARHGMQSDTLTGLAQLHLKRTERASGVSSL